MRKHGIVLIIFALFLLEGTVLPWLIPEVWQTQVLIAPQLVLVAVLYVSLLANRHFALALGFGFGLLHDFIFYGPMIGTYSFSIGITVYLVGLAFHRTPVRIVTSLFFIGIGLFLFEFIHYGLYRLFNLVTVSFQWTLLHKILPGMLFNLLFALIVYVPVRKLLVNIDAKTESQED